MNKDKFQLKLIGAFNIKAPDGGKIEIRSKKGKALIAMLATSKTGERTRAWLQDKLWSRGSSQDSLRRSVADLRSLFSKYKLDVLPKDIPREVIRLDKTYFEIDIELPSHSHRGQFLEGLDIAHENNLEEWLREQRSFYDVAKSSKVSRTVEYSEIISADNSTKSKTKRLCIGLFAEFLFLNGGKNNQKKSDFNDLLDRFAKLILSHGGMDLIDFRDNSISTNFTGETERNPKVKIRFKVTENLSSYMLLIQSIWLPNNHTISIRRNEIEKNADSNKNSDDIFLEFITEIVAELLHFLSHRLPNQFGSDANIPIRLVHEAVENMFNLTYVGLDKARINLDTALEYQEEGVFYAWRAYLLNQVLEDPRVTDVQSLREEMRYFSKRSIEADPFNTLSLSLLTHVHSFGLKEFDVAHEYLNRVKHLGIDHLMSYDADALLNFYLGKFDKSRLSAEYTVKLSRFLPFRHCFITTLCMIDGISGNFLSAVKHGELALKLQPCDAEKPYPPTIRYLAAIYNKVGEFGKAEKMINELKIANSTDSKLSDNLESHVIPTLEIEEFLKVNQQNFMQ